jgi:hypothetical protein
MARAQKAKYEVHVFRPSGMRFCVLPYECTSAQVAVGRAKKRVYQMGCLAHFYRYVAKLTPAPIVVGGDA